MSEHAATVGSGTSEAVLDDGARAAIAEKRLREAERELQRAKQALVDAQALARIGSWEWDIPANQVVWSDELFRIYGYEPQAFDPTYEEFLARVHPEDRDSVDERNRKAFADHQPFEDVKRIVRPDGSQFLMRTKGEVIEDDEGNPVRMIGICEDVTEEIEAAEARAALAAIVTGSEDAIVSTTPDGVITSWNPGAERLYGFTAAEAIGARSDELLMPPARADEQRRLVTLLRAGERVDHFETVHVRKDGSAVDVSLSLSPVRGPRGQLEGISAIARDVTERRRFAEQLRHLAGHDALTGVLNRNRLHDELARELSGAARHGRPGALVVLGVDNFAWVNETLGHGGGDELLRGIAATLRARARGGDVIARVGGDEFAVLAADTGPGEARAVAEDLLEAVREHALVAQGHTVRPTVSIGVALFDAGAGTADDVLGAATRALYEAKETGRNRVVLHTREAWGEARRRARGGWEHRIRHALDTDGFVLHCQPILDLVTGETSRFELLLRMQDGDALVPPASFLGVAERLGTIAEIDRWVVRQAIGLLADIEESHPGVQLEVNLSGRSVGDHRLVEMISREVAEAGVDPRGLIFEITETAAIANMDEARRFARALTDSGCSFALDDFGTGFGSFYYLKHIPAEYLKIDGDFVKSPRSRTDELVIEAIVQVARGLGKRTVAEWVGDRATEERMRALGVDFAQGYHVGRPAPPGEVLPAR